MTEKSQKFINELTKEIGSHPDKENIIAEYEHHVYELLADLSPPEEDVYNVLVQRLGTPVEIAKSWQLEKNITPKKTQWLFVFLNAVIFIGGAFLTIGYNVFHWQWIEYIWTILTDVSFVVIFVYCLFWALLGYEIGKEFGHRGYRLLQKTFLISIIPNLLLMYLIVFKVFPHKWFEPVLSLPFIVICIILTGLLYPISWIGYRWGRKVSV